MNIKRGILRQGVSITVQPKDVLRCIKEFGLKFTIEHSKSSLESTIKWINKNKKSY
jgi:hypothetical protein